MGINWGGFGSCQGLLRYGKNFRLFVGWRLLRMGGEWGWLVSNQRMGIDGGTGWLVGGGSDLRDLMGETTK